MRSDQTTKNRILDLLRGRELGRTTSDEIRELMPDLCTRQLTNAVNKLVNEGLVKRTSAYGERTNKYIVLSSRAANLGEIMEVRTPQQLAPLYSAFGIASSLDIDLEPIQRTPDRLVRGDGVVVHRAMRLTDKSSAD